MIDDKTLAYLPVNFARMVQSWEMQRMQVCCTVTRGKRGLEKINNSMRQIKVGCIVGRRLP